MSGGSWDYVYLKFRAMADALKEGRCTDSDAKARVTPKSAEARRRFGDLMELVAAAVHDIEWVDSSDLSEEDELEAINNVFDALKEKK